MAGPSFMSFSRFICWHFRTRDSKRACDLHCHEYVYWIVWATGNYCAGIPSLSVRILNLKFMVVMAAETMQK